MHAGKNVHRLHIPTITSQTEDDVISLQGVLDQSDSSNMKIDIFLYYCYLLILPFDLTTTVEGGLMCQVSEC